MEIKRVGVDISESDIISMVDEFLDVPEIKVTKVKIEDAIEINGYYKKIVKFRFGVKLRALYGKDSKLKLEFVYATFPINWKINWLKNAIIKLVGTIFKGIGIEAKKGVVTIDIKTLLKEKAPFVSFKINRFEVNKDVIYLDVREIQFNKDLKPLGEEAEKKTIKYTIKKNIDEYSTIRGNVKEKIEELPSYAKSASEFAISISDFIVLFGRLFVDKRVPFKTKMISGTILTYLVSPVDIIPSSVPVLGKVDDIALFIIGLNTLINSVDEKVLRENWDGEDDVIDVIKYALDQLTNITGAKKMSKLINTFITSKEKVEKAKKTAEIIVNSKNKDDNKKDDKDEKNTTKVEKKLVS